MCKKKNKIISNKNAADAVRSSTAEKSAPQKCIAL